MQENLAPGTWGVPEVPARRWAMLAACLALLGTLLASGWGAAADSLAPRTSRPSRALHATPVPRMPAAAHPARNSTPRVSTDHDGVPATPTPSGTLEHSVMRASQADGDGAAQSPALIPEGRAVSQEPAAAIGDATTLTTLPALAAVAVSGARFDGWLVGPDAISATYPVTTPGAWHAVLAWSGAQTLSISSDCAGLSSTRSGSSPLRVSGQGPACTLTVLGSPDVVSTAFHLDVDAA